MFSQRPGCDQNIASLQQIPHFVPVDFSPVEPERHPPFRSDVSGKIESFRLSLDQRFVVAGLHFARHSDDAVSVMIVQEVSEGLFPYQELRMGSGGHPRGIRKGQSDLRQAGEARVFGRRIGHGIPC